MTHTLYRGKNRILLDAAMQTVVLERQIQHRATVAASLQFPQSSPEHTFAEILDSQQVRLAKCGPPPTPGPQPNPNSSPIGETLPVTVNRFLKHCAPERVTAIPLRFRQREDGVLDPQPFNHHYYNQSKRVVPSHPSTH